MSMQHLKDSQGDSPCYNCGTDENPIWFTDNVFWNNVMGKLRYKVFCVNCFTVRAEKKMAKK